MTYNNNCPRDAFEKHSSTYQKWSQMLLVSSIVVLSQDLLRSKICGLMIWVCSDHFMLFRFLKYLSFCWVIRESAILSSYDSKYYQVVKTVVWRVVTVHFALNTCSVKKISYRSQWAKQGSALYLISPSVKVSKRKTFCDKTTVIMSTYFVAKEIHLKHLFHSIRLSDFILNTSCFLCDGVHIPRPSVCLTSHTTYSHTAVSPWLWGWLC